MTLSQDEVNNLLKTRFTCAWVNIQRDPAAGMSHPHPPTDQGMQIPRGLGEHNTQMLMLTPDGKLINALAGYIGPEDLAEELRLSLSLLDQLNSEREAARKALVSKTHLKVAEELSKRKSDGFFEAASQFCGNAMTVGNRRGVEDHRFVAKNPLMPAKTFTTALMVGNAKSAFVWHSSGTPGMKTGQPAMPNLPFGDVNAMARFFQNPQKFMDEFQKQSTVRPPVR